MQRLIPSFAVALVGLGVLASPAQAQDASLGGGSDIAAGTVVEVAAGTVIPPVHHLFADNPEAQPIEVEFRADAPPGIDITSDQERYTIAPGESARAPFSIGVADTVVAGDYEVSVQLVRSDIESQPGEVTNIPAVGTAFTVSVVGEAATITVRAQSEQSGRPVDGTLTLSAVTAPAATFEVARIEGSELSARVAPGEYRAAYLLDGRELASTDATVAAGASKEVVLQVRSVSFVIVAARPIEEDGKVVVADLVASVENHLRPLDGPVVIEATVRRDGEEVDSLVLDELDGLAPGVTEATLTYRPSEGFSEGTYQFEFTLTSPDLTLHAVDSPGFDVSGGNVSPYVIAGTLAAGLIVAGGTAWRFLRHRPRGATPRHARHASGA